MPRQLLLTHAYLWVLAQWQQLAWQHPQDRHHQLRLCLVMGFSSQTLTRPLSSLPWSVSLPSPDRQQMMSYPRHSQRQPQQQLSARYHNMRVLAPLWWMCSQFLSEWEPRILLKSWMLYIGIEVKEIQQMDFQTNVKQNFAKVGLLAWGDSLLNPWTNLLSASQMTGL